MPRDIPEGGSLWPKRREFICPQCGKIFFSPGAVRSHIRMAHLKVRRDVQGAKGKP